MVCRCDPCLGRQVDRRVAVCYNVYMFDKLKARLPNASVSEIETIVKISETYNLEPTVRNFDGLGFLFRDLRGRTARVCEASYRGSSLHVKQPKTEIAIIALDGIVAGWIETDKLEDLEDRLIVNQSSLNKMPEIFSFDQECAHLTVHGGFYEGKYWTCIGCERQLVFNDKK